MSDHVSPPYNANASPAIRQRKSYWLRILAALLLFIVLMNFIPLHIATSQQETNATLETGRTGETLPANMAPGFTLYVLVEGTSELATTVQEALPDALADTNVGNVTAVADLSAVDGPRLFITTDVERLWTPLYGRARVTANLYFANVVDVPWPDDKPMILTESPEIQATGEISISDTTWGLLSKPAYNQLLGRAMAEAVAAKLQDNVFRLP